MKRLGMIPDIAMTVLICVFPISHDLIPEKSFRTTKANMLL